MQELHSQIELELTFSPCIVKYYKVLESSKSVVQYRDYLPIVPEHLGFLTHNLAKSPNNIAKSPNNQRPGSCIVESAQHD